MARITNHQLRTIRDRCLSLIALHAPVARDARLTTGIPDAIVDLELIGDDAYEIVTIGGSMKMRPPSQIMHQIAEVVSRTRGALSSTLDGWRSEEAGPCPPIEPEAAAIRAGCHVLDDKLSRLASGPGDAMPYGNLMPICRHPERISARGLCRRTGGQRRTHELRSMKPIRQLRIPALLFAVALHVAAQQASQQQTAAPTDQATQAGADATQPVDQPVDAERWNIFYQATSIGQYHGTFRSPYAGPFSLQDYPERDVSLTTTIFLSLRLSPLTTLVFDPEIAGGRGFSGVNGMANPSNGELPRVASATPKPYLARLFVSHDFSLGGGTEPTESDVNQLAGSRPLKRYTITAGRFSITDFFDDNRYTHDPRSQFMGWAVMYNGAWDYPADTRGYTWGWVHELHFSKWSVRYASAAMSKVANGSQFDRRLFVNRGDVVEGERDWTLGKHDGAVRLLGYTNHADAGNYAAAIRLARQTSEVPDITAVRRNGTLKYGVGISADQELATGIGLFMRLGWNDGKTESFEFTAMDRLATGGISFNGARWRRPNDTVAGELTVGGISGVHALYLAMGGNDFLIGDGRLEYDPEYVLEWYYSARLFPGFFVSYDMQHVTNPAYNEQRGPLWIYSIRLHMEFGKDTFSKKSAKP